MAHKCPRCGGPVQRGYSGTAQMVAGIPGALFYAAFGDFQCGKCGKISKSEFPPEVRAKIAQTTAILVVSAIAVTILALYLIANLNT